MIVKLCLLILLPLSMGFILTHTYLPLKNTISSSFLLKISLAVGLGFGITSCNYFLCLLTLGPKILGVILTETGLLVLLMFLYITKKRIYSETDITHEKRLHHFKLRRILSMGFYSVLILAITNFLNMAMRLPNGAWDSWAIWNMHARFIYRGGEYWKDAFSSFLAPDHHPDYPLLVPLSVSRGWAFVGVETYAVPMLIALLFTFAVVGTLYSSLAVLRSKSQGILASSLLLCTTIFLILGTFQYADVPIGFYFLSSIVLVMLQERFPDKYSLSFLAGTMAAFSGWTKNEGLLFLLSLFMAQIITTFFSQDRKMHMKQLMYFTLGSMPVLAVILYFKLNLAPPNELVSGERSIGAVILKLKDWDRHAQILKAFLMDTIFTLPQVLFLLFYSLYFGTKIEVKKKMSVVASLIVLTFMFCGYYFIYLITPYDLNWHIESSFRRLLIQLWPSVLLTFFMIVRTPEEALSEVKAEQSMGNKQIC